MEESWIKKILNLNLERETITNMSGALYSLYLINQSKLKSLFFKFSSILPGGSWIIVVIQYLYIQ